MSAPDRLILLDALKEVIDPELGYNVVDLGLIYDLTVEGTVVKVTMTMTTPGCPAQHAISGGVEECLKHQRGVEQVNVEVVWQPRWTPQRISDAAKSYLGIMARPPRHQTFARLHRPQRPMRTP